MGKVILLSGAAQLLAAADEIRSALERDGFNDKVFSDLVSSEALCTAEYGLTHREDSRGINGIVLVHRSIEQNDAWYVNCVYVHPSVRKQHIGYQLVVAAFASLRRRSRTRQISIFSSSPWMDRIIVKLWTEEVSLRSILSVKGRNNVYADADRRERVRVTTG